MLADKFKRLKDIIFTMNKRVLTLFTVALVLIYAFSAFALTVNDVSPNTTSDQTAQQTQLAQMNANMQAGFDALNKKLDGYPTQEQIMKDAQALLEAQANMLEQFKSALIVMLIVCGFAFLGLFYGVYFVFKSKGRV
jgi:predicted PurR-regulated permease PerM